MASQTDVEIRQATKEDIPNILSLIRDLADFEHALSSVHATPELLSKTIAFDGQETSATRPARCLILTVPDTDTNSTIDTSAPSSSSDHPAAPTPHPNPSPNTNTNTNTFLSNTSPTPQPTPPTYTKRKTAALALYFHNYSTWLCTPGIYLEDLYVIPSERRKGHATLLLAQLAREVLKLGGDGAGVSGRLEWSVLKWNVEAVKFYEGETVGAKMMDEWVGMRVEGGEGLRKLAGQGL